MSASCLRCPNLNCRCETEICPTITYRLVLFFNQAFLNWINSPVSFVAGTQITIVAYRLAEGSTIIPVTSTIIGNVPISYANMSQALHKLGWEISDLGIGLGLGLGPSGPFQATLRNQPEIISHVLINDASLPTVPPFSISLPVNFSEIEKCDASGYKFRNNC